MRETVENPRDMPALRPAIAVAEELGCVIGGGYKMGDTLAGFCLTDPHGREFLIEVGPHNFRKGGKLVRKAVLRPLTPG